MGGFEAWQMGGPSAMRVFAPTVLASVAGASAAWPDTLSETRVAMIRTVAAEAHGLRPLERPRDRPRADLVQPQSEVLAFAEQFAADVTMIDDEMRADFRAAMGMSALAAAEAIYIADVVPRMRSMLNALFGQEEWLDAPLTATSQLPSLIDELMREITLLDALDPITTDLVRLRAGRQHGCRVCMSRRYLDAVEAGATASTYQAVDFYRHGELTAAQQAALGLVDAMILTPASPRRTDIAAARQHLSPEQALEVVLDTVRNSSAKVLVALGTDIPRAEGIELFRYTAIGDLAFP